MKKEQAVSVLLLLLLAISSSVSVAQSDCAPSATTACLVQDRFEVTIEFDTAGAAFVPSAVGSISGNAEIAFRTEDTAAFSFYESEQMDVLVKVLNGCPINDRFWVLAAGATDTEVRLSVTDTETGQSAEYVSVGGQPFAPIADTSAFATCPDIAPTAPPPMASNDNNSQSPNSLRGACGGAFCLQNDQFALDVAFDTFQGNSGQMNNAFSVDHSGLGWAFDEDNLEHISTVIDGRADSGTFWFLTSPVTNVELIYTLTDTATGLSNIYLDPIGPATTLLDRGQPIEPQLQPLAIRGAPADAVSFELVLTNSAPAAREFSALIPTPAGAANPRFTCTAADGAVCPQTSGSGTFAVAGPLAAGGRLTYVYSVDRALARGADSSVEASVETAAHALSEAVTRIVSTGIPAAPVAVTGTDRWALIVLALMLGLIAALRTGRSI